MASTNPNGLSTVMPGAGTSFAVNAATEVKNLSIDTDCLAAQAVTAAKIANNTITNAQMAAGTVGSAQLAASLLRYTTVTLTATQIKAMSTTPVEIIPAQGAGTSIIVEQVLARFTYGTAQMTAGGAWGLQYGNTAALGGTKVCVTGAAGVIQAAADSDTILGLDDAALTATKNAGIFASNDTADFATGTVSTLAFHIWYRVV